MYPRLFDLYPVIDGSRLAASIDMWSFPTTGGISVDELTASCSTLNFFGDPYRVYDDRAFPIRSFLFLRFPTNVLLPSFPPPGRCKIYMIDSITDEKVTIPTGSEADKYRVKSTTAISNHGEGPGHFVGLAIRLRFSTERGDMTTTMVGSMRKNMVLRQVQLYHGHRNMCAESQWA